MDGMKSKLSIFKIFSSWLNPSLTLLCLGFSLVFVLPAHAAEFRSILSTKAITYDAPSAESNKLYIMHQGYPVEVIVNLGSWVKVRDQRGGLSWAEGKDLDNKRMVLVTTQSDIRETESIASTLLATIEQDIVLELLSPSINQGWVKVKHRDGIVGYIQSSAIWGVH